MGTPSSFRSGLRSLVIVMATFLSVTTNGQFAVFERYEDFENETPKVYHRFKFHSRKGDSDTRIVLRDSVDRAKLEIDCRNIWGFVYEGMLYRIMRRGAYYSGERNNFPVALIHHEGLFYWANGRFLENTKEQQWWSALDDTYTGFLSSSIEGDACLAHGYAATPDGATTGATNFFGDHPEYQWLQECVAVRAKGDYPHEFMYHCIKQHYYKEEQE